MKALLCPPAVPCTAAYDHSLFNPHQYSEKLLAYLRPSLKTRVLFRVPPLPVLTLELGHRKKGANSAKRLASEQDDAPKRLNLKPHTVVQAQSNAAVPAATQPYRCVKSCAVSESQGNAARQSIHLSPHQKGKHASGIFHGSLLSWLCEVWLQQLVYWFITIVAKRVRKVRRDLPGVDLYGPALRDRGKQDPRGQHHRYFHRLRPDDGWFSEFPGGRRLVSTTWPWTIRPSLAVLWGVCWMFYGESWEHLSSGWPTQTSQPSSAHTLSRNASPLDEALPTSMSTSAFEAGMMEAWASEQMQAVGLNPSTSDEGRNIVPQPDLRFRHSAGAAPQSRAVPDQVSSSYRVNNTSAQPHQRQRQQQQQHQQHNHFHNHRQDPDHRSQERPEVRVQVVGLGLGLDDASTKNLDLDLSQSPASHGTCTSASASASASASRNSPPCATFPASGYTAPSQPFNPPHHPAAPAHRPFPSNFQAASSSSSSSLDWAFLPQSSGHLTPPNPQVVLRQAAPSLQSLPNSTHQRPVNPGNIYHQLPSRHLPYNPNHHHSSFQHSTELLSPQHSRDYRFAAFGHGMPHSTYDDNATSVLSPVSMPEEDQRARSPAAYTAAAAIADVDRKPSATSITSNPPSAAAMADDAEEPMSTSPRSAVQAFRRDEEPPRNAQGQIVCRVTSCEGKTFPRKCEWSKHMDKHERPYKCFRPGCEKLQGFTYSGGLLRHEREVHKLHGGTEKALYCPHRDCKRHSGSGFTRKENLLEHLRRVHRRASGEPDAPMIDQEMQSPSTEESTVAKAISSKRKRSSIVAPADESADAEDEGGLRAEIKRLRAENEAKDKRLAALEEAVSKLTHQPQPEQAGG